MTGHDRTGHDATVHDATVHDAPLPRVLGRRRHLHLVHVVLAAAVVASWLVQVHRGIDTAPAVVVAVLVLVVEVQIVLSLLDRPRVAPPGAVDHLEVVALVPCYNEDPTALRACLRGFLTQTRLPQAVVVVDDGSTDADYGEVRRWFVDEAPRRGVRGTWVRQENAGKRHAQVRGTVEEPGADIYVTVDSDSILDRRALETGLAPFADPDVQSVAAVILTTNVATNLLTRVVDVYCASLNLFERAAFSRLGSVLVNSGGCALYRGDILRDEVDTYLGETIAGRPVQFSDDSLLTLFALRRGKAVQQADCFAFTLMPDRFSHHRRQQLRWMRGSFIRSGWRLRFLPLHRTAYWLHLVKWLLYAATTATFAYVVASGHLADPVAAGSAVVGALCLYTLTTLRYATIVRSDRTWAQTMRTAALAPLAGAWSLTFLRVLRWYGMATFLDTGWGTRGSVEVHSDDADVDARHEPRTVTR